MDEQHTMQNIENNSEGYAPTKAEVFDFLNSQFLGVIGTVTTAGQPQVATVAFSQTPDLELIIGTDVTSRKAINLDGDTRCAFVVTDPTARYTVQLEATVQKLTADELGHYEAAHFAKLPTSSPFRDLVGQVYFLLTPTSLKFTDCNPHPWVVTAFEF
jgi:hypothetical protein